MKVLLLSDTHSHLPENLLKFANDCDEIWHAGDIGHLDLYLSLKALKPTRAVYGNIDGPQLRNLLNEDLIFNCEGLKVVMTHIAGSADKINQRANKIIKLEKPQLFICGHSHILCIKNINFVENCLFVNPGAAGNEGFHKTKTIVLLEIEEGNIKSLKVVELGKRGNNL